MDNFVTVPCEHKRDKKNNKNDRPFCLFTVLFLKGWMYNLYFFFTDKGCENKF